MTAIEPDLPALLCFSVLWTICCVVFFLLADHVPATGRIASEVTGFEFGLIVANFALLLGLAASSLFYGIAQLKATSVIVALGLIFLFTPGLLRFAPPAIANPGSGPIILVVIQITVLCLWWTAQAATLPG